MQKLFLLLFLSFSLFGKQQQAVPNPNPAQGLPFYPLATSPLNQTCIQNYDVVKFATATGIQVYTCGGGGTPNVYGIVPSGAASSVPIDGVTGDAAGSGTYVSGPLTNNSVVTTAPGSGAIQKTQNAKNSDTISILDFVNNTAAGYVPARLSTQINNAASAVSVTSGSAILNCTGCAFTSADQGNPIVVLQENTTNEFQSIISTYVSATQVILSSNATFTSTSAFMYTGTDSTSQIDAWLAQIKSKNKCGYVPANQSGQTFGYFYQGSGLSGWNTPCIVGDNGLQSVFFLGAGKYLLDMNEFLFSLDVERIGFFGGAGGIRNRSTGQNVSPGPFVIAANYFRDFSGSAVSFNSSDFTYLNILWNFFQGLNTSQSFGYASASADQGTIVGNAFVNQRIGLKLGGCNTRIHDNDFIEFSGENPTSQYTRAAIWIVPPPSYTGSLDGCFVYANKFGNENLDTQDVRVLAADQVPPSGSSYFGDTLFLTTASTSWFQQISFTDNLINGGTVGGTGSGVNPIFYSYTPNFYGNKITGLLGGTLPGYVVQFDSSLTQSDSSYIFGNSIGPFTFPYNGSYGMKNSNWLGVGLVSDPTSQFVTADPTVITRFTTGTSSAGFQNYITGTLPSAYGFVQASYATITDSQGGADAITLTSTASNAGEVYVQPISLPSFGQQLWIEFDAELSSTGTPAASMFVQIADAYSTPIYYQQQVSLSSGWTHYKLPYVLQSAPLHGTINLQFTLNGTGAASGSTFNLGLVRFYAAKEPVSGGRFIYPVFSNSVRSGSSSNTDLTGELSFSSATTASYTFAGTYSSHPECVLQAQGSTTTSGAPYPTYTGTTSFTINFPVAFTGNVSYSCVGRN